METVYRDYSSKGVKFYYVYKQLAHPETNSYIDPLTIKERLAHVKAARLSLKTEFTWICDNMDNDLKHAMGNSPNSEFIIDPNGKVVVKRSWSNPRQLRADLEKLVGKSKSTTSVNDLGYQISVMPEQVAKGVVKRIEMPGRMTALKTELKTSSEGTKYYVKLRAEADDQTLNRNDGKLYIAFHVDPIYKVHWNNQGQPISYKLEFANGKSINGEFPNPKVKADADPREVLVEIDADKTSGPIKVTAKFLICDDAETFCVPFFQEYTILLERDPEIGWRMGNRGGGRGGGGRGGAGGRGGGAQAGEFIKRMMQRDENNDGKLSIDEMPERAGQMFDRSDSNNDGFLDKSELEAMRARMGQRGGRGRGQNNNTRRGGGRQ